MNKIKAFFSRLFAYLSHALQQLSRKEWSMIAGTVVGVAAIVWLSVQLVEEPPFYVDKEINPAYEAYISAYTTGVVSTAASIQVRLAQPGIDTSAIGKEVEDNLFAFSPSVTGRSYWQDTRTLTFLPNQKLDAGKTYQVRFALEKVTPVPDSLADFTFALRTMMQNYDMKVEGLTIYEEKDTTRQTLEGTLLTADVAEAVSVERMLRAVQKDSTLSIRWNHEDGRTHHFTVEDIARQDSAAQVVLTSTGVPIEVSKSQDDTVHIPARGVFSLLRSEVVEEPEQYITLRFSEPLQKNQSLQGLIRVGKQEKLRFMIENNMVRIYPGTRLEGANTLAVYPGIRNVQGRKLQEKTEVDFQFEPLKPAVRMISEGVILPGMDVPGTDGMVLPFEAVNLKAVDVTVVKVFEDNIAQFFQVNRFGESQELRRVGRPVARQTTPLNASGVTDLGKWNRFTLDLSTIINTDPGALYQVNLSFRQSQSLYACSNTETSDEPDTFTATDDWDDPSKIYWEAYNEYYYATNFNWEERDNPCHASYYGYRRSVQKNLMASDLGIIAKRGEDDNLTVFVTNILTTRPTLGVEVSILDVQQQEIAKGITDSDGKAALKLPRNPFLLVARDKKQRGYLRLDDGNALPISQFEVAGQQRHNGLKGFLYGDRGVWRPGDSLHLNFVLEDRTASLPKQYPVIFELKNPRGQIVQRIVRNNPVGSLYNFSTATPEDALTGNWTAYVQVGDARFSRNIPIETIKPNRLKIDLNFGVEKFTDNNPSVTGQLNVSWLSGATARGLKATYDLLLTKARTTFEDYPDYVFEDEARTFQTEKKQVFEGTLDEQGKALVKANLKLETPVPGVLTATFAGKVFEEGGNFSIDQVSLPYYPYTTFVGLQLPESSGDGMQDAMLTDEPHTVNLVTVNADGKLVPGQIVEVAIYKLDWRWWYDQSENDIANYLASEDRQPVSEEKISLTDGKGQWAFSVAEKEWGRYYLRACDPASGHCAGQTIYLDWPGYAGREGQGSPKAAAMLRFSADKEKYQVGDEATIRIPGGRQGRALVSLEDGSRVLETHWVNLSEAEETTFTFEVTQAMAPNIYAHVSLLQPHAQTVNDLPIRLYGVIPIPVEAPQTYLEPVIVLPEKLEPETKVTIKVSERNNKPMAYTLAVVDEGLLDITNFKTPEPHAYFYAREALGVKTWDLYDAVIGAYGGRLERILSVGGGEAGVNAGARKANRFAPVVRFFGSFLLEEGKENTHTFMMPNYVGSVRTMVVAAYEGAYGHAEATTPVSKPLMVLGTLPRVLRPQESLQLPVNVFAMENSVKNVSVSVSTNKLLTITGGTSKKLSFKAKGDQVVDFAMQVPDRTGMGEVQIQAAAGPLQATYKTEIDIRNPNVPVTEAISTLIEPGKTWNTSFTPIGMAGTRSAVLEISSVPPLNVSKRLSELINYPHGCVEQIVSAAFPQLFLQNIETLSESEQKKVEAHVKAALQKLSTFQTNEGAFAYWPGSHDADEWATSYAGHFLLEAKDKGYSVPAGLLNAWSTYQQRRASQWGASTGYTRDDLIQAYRLYTLVLAGNAQQGAMNRMREQSGLTVQAKWRLAAAYALLNQQEAAEEMINNLSEDIPAYREMYGTYGSALRDEAMILETLSLLKKREQGLTLFRRISAALSDENRWMSTQTTAYCLVAATQFVKDQSLSSQIKAAYATGKQETANLQSELSVVQRDIPLTGSGAQTVQVVNQGKGELYARIVMRGTPEMGQEKAGANGLRLQVTYKGTDGEVVHPDALAQGTDFVAEVTVHNPGLQGDYRQLALTHIVPSGWEIINTRLQNPDQFNAQNVPDYQDIRDDRVYTYFNLAANERKTFKILLNATYAGRFYQPAIQCEAMYDHTIRASTGGEWVEVVQAQ